MTVERPRHLGISTLWIALRGRQGVEPVEQREAGKNGDYRARSFSEPEVSAQLQLSMRGFAFLPSTFGAPSGHHPAICCESKRPSLQNEFRERVQVLVKNMDLRFSPDGYLSWMSRNSCRETRKSFPPTSPGRDGRIQSPARQCRERKATETKSPLGDGTTNLLVRRHSNLSVFP
jgi:hypothetical protein